jgi:hypothetical protein
LLCHTVRMMPFEVSLMGLRDIGHEGLPINLVELGL